MGQKGLALAAALWVTGCGPAEEPLAGARHAVVDGYTDTSDTAVVALLHQASGSLCSGSLIAPNAVLTARHCVSPTISADDGIVCGQSTFGAPLAAAGFAMTTAHEIMSAAEGEFDAVEVVAAPADGDGFCGHDAAIVILGENVPSTTASPLTPQLEAVAVADVYSVVGYGAINGDGDDFGVRRRRDELLVVCLGTVCNDSSIVAEEWQGAGAVCQGDSGGPALTEDGLVSGITSRGSLDCTVSIYTATWAYSQWLKDTVVYASGMGLYDAPGWTAGSTVDPVYSMPVGAACSSAGECPTGRCRDGYCTRPCDDAHACPERFVCDGASGECVVQAPPTPPQYQRPDRDEGCNVGAARPGAARHLVWLALVLGLRRRRLPASRAPATMAG
jgi:hypothetical protein